MKMAFIIVLAFLAMAFTVVNVIDGAPVALKCQLKNGILGISFQGARHECYAEDGSDICGNLGFHVYEVKLMEECRHCCPGKTTNIPIVVTVVTTNQPDQHHATKETWIYVIIGVFGALAVAVAIAIFGYHKNCWCTDKRQANGPEMDHLADANGPEQVGNQEEVRIGGLQPSDADEKKSPAA